MVHLLEHRFETLQKLYAKHAFFIDKSRKIIIREILSSKLGSFRLTLVSHWQLVGIYVVLFHTTPKFSHQSGGGPETMIS